MSQVKYTPGTLMRAHAVKPVRCTRQTRARMASSTAYTVLCADAFVCGTGMRVAETQTASGMSRDRPPEDFDGPTRVRTTRHVPQGDGSTIAPPRPPIADDACPPQEAAGPTRVGPRGSFAKVGVSDEASGARARQVTDGVPFPPNSTARDSHACPPNERGRVGPRVGTAGGAGMDDHDFAQRAAFQFRREVTRGAAAAGATVTPCCSDVMSCSYGVYSCGSYSYGLSIRWLLGRR